jgi:hypothetical protein|nr:MAG TPA: hypothetical protein [Caudoviricetes sp.]
MEKKIYASRDVFIVDYFECNDGMYKLAIYDNYKHSHNPKLFKDCDVEGITAVNLTWDDVQEFFTAVKDSTYYVYPGIWFDFLYKDISGPRGVYTVAIIECSNGTYEISIRDNKYVYKNPREFMDCITEGSLAFKLTPDDVKAFCIAVEKSVN